MSGVNQSFFAIARERELRAQKGDESEVLSGEIP
jgi:hypothetical protein